MRIEFPADYPHQPFFVRLVSPRYRQHQQHKHMPCHAAYHSGLIWTE